MALNPKALEGYIIKEFSDAFGITDESTLQKFAEALSKAVDTYLKDDVQVAVGQVVTGKDSQAGDLVGAKTSTPGKLF